MSAFLFVAVLVAVCLVIYSTWKEIEAETPKPKPELSIETIIEAPLTDVVPPVQEEATTVVKKPRKPRTSKINDAREK